MVFVDFLCEEVGFGENHSSNGRVVCLVYDAAKTGGLDYGSICFEQTLVVSEVIREDVEEVAGVRYTGRAWDIAGNAAGDSNCDWSR